MSESERARLIALCTEDGDFVAGDDGFWMYWPNRVKGGLTEWMVRVILEEIERRNGPVQREWERRVDEAIVEADTAVPEEFFRP